MKPILITGALCSEINYLVEKLENLEETFIGKFKAYKGLINNYPVVIIKTEVGLVNSSSAVTLAIEKIDPLFIINEGTAGGITEKHHKKDIIIGKQVLNIVSCKTPFKEIGEGSNSTTWDLMTFTDGMEDKKTLFDGGDNSNLINTILDNKDLYKNGNVYTGIIGSGDIWNREKDKLKYLSEVHNVDCEDMESISIYTIASYYKIPAVCIKIMSDNELLEEEYEPNVARYLQEFVYEILKEMIGKI